MAALSGVLRKLKFDRFLGLLLGAVLLASLFPAGPSAQPIVSAAANVGIFLLFFFHGAKLPFDALLAGLTHWRLHLTVLAISFALFPALGLLAQPLASALGLGGLLVAGLLFLCCLPSTVQSSIAFTSLAGGNVAAAICAASASNILGIVLTPLIVSALLATHSSFDLSSIGSIALKLLLPFLLGQIARPVLHRWVASKKRFLSLIDRGAILLMVYSAFGQAVRDGIWHRLSVQEIMITMLLCALLLAIIMSLTFFIAGRFGFARADRITIIFCGSKKSLVTGVPMASVLFPAATAGVVIIPLMIFHQMQLMICSVLAHRFASTENNADIAGSGATAGATNV